MRRRLRRRPAPRKALKPKTAIGKAPGSDDSGALRLVLLPPGSIGFRLERRLSSWVPHGKRLSSSFLQGTRPRFASGTLMSRSDDTAFPCWGTMRVRPRFPGSRSRPRCRSVPVHLPEATSGYPLGCSPKRSKEERSAREGGFPCRSVGRCAPAAFLGKGRGTRTTPPLACSPNQH